MVGVQRSGAAGVLLVAGLVLLVGLVLLGAIGQVEVPTIQTGAQAGTKVPAWLRDQVTIPEGLTIDGHAQKHQDQALDAWLLYDLLVNGQCVASRQWCKGGKELYLCVDPASGMIGGLLVNGNQIITGYAGSEAYWHGKVMDWERCDGRQYR